MTEIPIVEHSRDEAGLGSHANRPLVSLTHRMRILIATLALAIAALHVSRPELAIDAVFLGLIGFALFIYFFDIDAVEWQGIRARRRLLEKKADEVKAIPVSNTDIPRTPPPPATDGTLAVADVVHREPDDLMPPVDRAERLFWVAEQIRIELVILAGNGGRLPSRRGFDSYQAVPLAQSIAEQGTIPAELIGPIRSVVEQRNSLAHGPFGWRIIGEAASNLGFEVLSKLRSIKGQYIRVLAYPIDLFRDQSLSGRHKEKGIMLEQIGAEKNSISVFPTGLTYLPGRFVTWEWDSSGGLDEEAWYLHPTSKKAKLAFSSASLFAGREYPDQWGLEFRVPGPFRL